MGISFIITSANSTSKFNLEGGEINLAKVKCPFFLSKTNGKKLFINCSKEKFIDESSLRKEFDYVEVRKVCFEINCCNDFYHCGNYVKLKGGEINVG